jgi:hypothetical protein
MESVIDKINVGLSRYGAVLSEVSGGVKLVCENGKEKYWTYGNPTFGMVKDMHKRGIFAPYAKAGRALPNLDGFTVEQAIARLQEMVT